MFAKRPGFQVILVLTILGLMGMARAVRASTYYAKYDGLVATTLGGGFTFKTDGTGYITDVVSADGSQDYKFDKVPVNHDSLATLPPESWMSGELHYVYTALDNKYGTQQFTYYPYGYGGAGPTSIFQFQYAPSGAGLWYDYGVMSPVNDFNIHGAVVGTNGGGSSGSNGAAGSSQFGFLQNDFPSIPGVVFNSGLYVDDLGQIIASGTLDGKPQDFLVTPGLPTPAPESSTFAILGCVLATYIIRPTFRRLRARMAA